MSLLYLSALAAAVAAVGSVEVRSRTDCPSADELSASLRDVLPNDIALAAGGDVASVELVPTRAGGTTEPRSRVRLQWLRPDGSVADERLFDLQNDCRMMAHSIAGVFGAWMVSPAIARPELRSSSPPPSAPLATGRLAETASEPPPARFGVAVGAAAGAALVGGVTAAGSIEALLGLGSASPWWQWRIAVMAQADRQRAFADGGRVSWQHTTAAAGPMLRSAGATWRLAADIGPILGWATLAGDGNGSWDGRQDRVFEYGGGGGVRIERRLGRIAMWLEWRTHVWAKAQQAVVPLGAEPEQRTTLSRYDMMASLGGSVAIYP